jgi:iron complex outermembrane recepter protein
MPLHAGAAAWGTAAGAAAEQTPEQQIPEIVVTAPSLFRDVRPERSLDEASISSYGVSTVDELIGEIQAELGEDEDPVFVVNGERVYDLDDIGAYPVEVVRQLQVLPRGSAARLGGLPNQRVISLLLRRQVRSGTVTVAPRLATDGDWGASRGETIFTHVSGRRRGNVTLRVRDESPLLESQRGIIQPVAQIPYAIGGNIIAYPDLSGEIDPLLSAAAGETVTIVPVPANTNPTLGQFAASANQENVTDVGDFRTLRPALRSYELNATFTAPLTSWLTSTTTLRFGRSTSRSNLGLPSSIFVLGPDNRASPFSVPVGLALFGEDPLQSRYRRDSREGNVTLTARLGGTWRAVFNGKHSQSIDSSRTERPGSREPIPIDDSADPFGSSLGDLVPTESDFSRSWYRTTTAQLSVTGSPVRLPAGDPTVTLEGRLGWRSLRSSSSFSEGPRNLRRSEQSIRGVVDVPITSRRNDFLAEIGELTASAEYARLHFSDAGSADRGIASLAWEPRDFLRLRGSLEISKEPAPVELLGAATTITPSVRLFDVMTGDTVEVTYVSGGNPDLRPQSTDTKRASAILRLAPSLGLQLSAEYTDIRQLDFVTSLPPVSEAVMLAFPDRFIRDAEGVLTLVDVRPVNFADHRQKRLRYGFSLNAPLGGGGRPGFSASSADGEESTDEAPQPAAAARPATRAQLTANHSLVFLDKIQIRPEAEPVDLLKGGAIGIAGGRVRHEFDATAAVTSGGTGVRLGLAWRGGSLLQTRIGGEQSLLRFSPVFLVNLRAFADARRLFPGSGWSSGTRFSINLVNLTDRRQRVRDPFGHTPLQYQPAYRDPIGRTIEFELRKIF